MSVPSGSRLGPYIVGEPLGSGAWFTASEDGLERTVTLLITPLPADDRALATLRERARHLAALSDARLLPVYAQGEDGHVLWLATRQLDGRPFAEVGRLDERRAARLGAQVARQLTALEEAGAPPLTVGADDLLVEGDGELERIWLLPDPERPVSDDTGSATRSLVELLEREVGRPLLPAPPPDAGALADVLAGLAARPPRHRRRLLAGGVAAAAVLAALAALLAVALTGNDTSPATQTPTRAAIARVAARIPVGAGIGAIAAGGNEVWLSTVKGELIHVDARTNRVVGAPLPGRPGIDLLLDRGVLLSAGPEVVRATASTGRVLARVSGFGPVRFATSLLVTDGAVWATIVEPPSLAGRAVRFDVVSLRRLGQTDVSGGFPVLVAGDGTSVWLANLNDGTLSRAGTRGGVTTIKTGAQGRYPASAAGLLWIPSGLDRTVVGVDPARMTIDRVVRFPASAIAAAAGGGSVWVLTEQPNRIYRIDPRSGQILGAPIPAPTGATHLRFGAGSLWVDAPKAKALVRLAPTTPAPAPRSPEPGRGVLQAGPVPTGRRLRVTVFERPFSIAAADGGWLASGLAARTLSVIEIRHEGNGLNVVTPDSVFDASAHLTPVGSPAEFIRVLRLNPQLRVGSVERVRLGGVEAVRVRVRAEPKAPFPANCGGRPCVPLFPLLHGTGFLEPGVDELTLVQRGQVLFVFDAGLRDGSTAASATRLRRLVDSIRFAR